MASAAFNPVKLGIINARMEELWGDSQIKKNYTAKADSLNAILTRQTARIKGLEDSDTDQDVRVSWLDFKDATVQTFDWETTGPEVCDIDGPELEAASKDYALDTFTEKAFKIERTGSMKGGGFRSVDPKAATYEDAVAIGLMRTRKALVEDMNKRVLVKLDSFTGTNKYMGTYTDPGATGDTIIPAADYNARKLLPYLARVQMMNRYVDPYILDGGLLWDDLYIAQFGAQGADTVKLQSLFGQFDITEDMWNFAAAGVDDRAYLIDKNAIAFASKTTYDPEPIKGEKEIYYYTMGLPELGNNVSADVVYQFKCVGNKFYDVWKLVLRYGLFQNPVIGDADLTGVLAFRKGAAV